MPVVLVYYFSYQFISRGIDSWFDVRVESALADAMELSRTALQLRVRDLLMRTEHIARFSDDHPPYRRCAGDRTCCGARTAPRTHPVER